MTKLEEYMKKNNISIRRFADIAGISTNYVFRLKKRYRGCSPSINVIKKIMKATNNEVKSEDWL